MKATTFLILALGAITGSSIQIDPNMEDGLFTADLSSGTASNVKMLARHDPQATATSPNLAVRSRIMQRKLPVDQATCSDIIYVDSAEYLQSLGKLQDYCNNKPNVQSKSIIGFKIGSSMAYMCNYGNKIECLTNELNDDMDTLNGRCSSQQMTGFVWHDHVKKVYGRAVTGESVCGNMG